MHRPTLAALCTLLIAGPLFGQADRRDRSYPELNVETGARTGTCDALFFSPDGKRLFAAGDDKVVRVWPVTGDGLVTDKETVLRWPSWREQRGGIKAVDLSPDGKYVAVGGYGVQSAAVSLINIETNEIPHSTAPGGKEDRGTVMAVAFSPDGKHVVYGTSYGGVWLWTPGSDGDGSRQLYTHEPAKGEEFNRIRMLRFLPDGRLVSAAEYGGVFVGDLGNNRKVAGDLSKGLTPRLTFFRAELSPDGKAIAATSRGRGVVLMPLDGGESRFIQLDKGRFPYDVAFDRDGKRLAVSVGEQITAPSGEPQFFMETDSRILIYDLTTEPPTPMPGPNHVGPAEEIAWNPVDGRLAVAGGDHHELRLWDLEKSRAEPRSEILASGRSLYGVRVSDDGRYIAFRAGRDPEAVHPNKRGTGDWFALDRTRRRPAELPQNVALPEPLATAGGWRVEPSAENGWQWYAVRGDKRHALPWDRDRQGEPRCYAFLPSDPGEPAMLAVGHYNGYTLYRLTDAGAEVWRAGAGHSGEVLSLAFGPNGEWLATASDDQTVSVWNLNPWPSQRELGAAVEVRGGKPFITAIDAGSPAWEAGLKVGDEVVLFAVDLNILYNRSGEYSEDLGGASAVTGALAELRPSLEHFIGVKRAGGDGMIKVNTTVRQRPMYRFFPSFDVGGTMVTDWVVWMWQNSYYLTSTNGDSLIGWHVNHPSMRKEPTFYKAEQFRDLFEKPAIVSALLQTHDLPRVLQLAMGANPQPLHFDKTEPAPVRLEVDRAGRTATVVAEVLGQNPDLLPRRVDLWVNDFLFQRWDAGGKAFRKAVKIPDDVLRKGDNQLTLQVFNDAGGRGQAVESVAFVPEKPRERKLWGQAIGINNYGEHRKLLPADGSREPFGDLRLAVSDAEMLREIWLAQKGRLYADAAIELLPNESAQRDAILAELDRIAGQAGPDDLMVMFLSGHGDFITTGAKGSRRTFVFCCPSYDPARFERTGLATEVLYEKLAKIKCRKVVFIDACHSGEAALNPVREFTPAGMGPVILAACDQNELAWENPKYGNGLFTYAVLEAMGDKFTRADGSVKGRPADGELDPDELITYVRLRLPELLAEVPLPKDIQNPVCFPHDPEAFPIARK